MAWQMSVGLLVLPSAERLLQAARTVAPPTRRARPARAAARVVRT